MSVKFIGKIVGTFFVIFLLSTTSELYAQSVSVGAGSYSTVTPPGKNEPQTQSGQPAFPRVSTEFNQLVNTNDYWSNLIFPYRENNHLNDVPAHPITIKSNENGFSIGYLNTNLSADNYYYYFARNNITVGIAGLTSNRTTTRSYGDWTFSAKLEYENASLIATTGHGLPYTYFDVEGGDIQIISDSTFSIWNNTNEVIGLSIDGVHYGLFAPNGSSWAGTDTLTSSLNNKGFLSVAILPDSTNETLEYYRSHAYAQVTNSVVDWDYDEFSSDLTTTFSYETALRDSTEGNSDQTLTALYRHQWLNTSDILTSYTYDSPRGEMKVFEGNSFSTTSRFSGILPSLPDVGEYDRIQLLNYVEEIAELEITALDTYNSGKQMGVAAELVHIADQLGAVAERDYFLSELKRILEDWFTVGGDREFSYNSTWNTVIGYPGSFGSSREINDHHFHYGYAIKAAATVAQYDSAWASQDNWGGMVNLIIRDANNWDKDDTMLPFLRNFDAYAGHGWASGSGDYAFGDVIPGNNQESSSESMNFATATILWGEMTGQEEIRDLGIFLYTNENEAIDQYWFDVDNEVFPDDFPFIALGRVWGDSGDYDTWFGRDPEFIHGINFLPINAGSFYLGKNPGYILENYNFAVAQRGGNLIHWDDVFWQYLAMSDADLALSYYNAEPDYQQFDGESKAHTLHWLYNMKEMGHYNTEITADIPTYAVFVNANNDTTYNAYNAGSSERLVSFSDGFNMTVPSNTMMTHSTAEVSESVPSAPVPEDEADKVLSIFSDSYASAVGANFDPQEGQSTIASIISLDGNNTLKYDSLDFQSIILDSPLNVQSRSAFNFDYFTDNSTLLQLTLISTNQSESIYDFTITTGEWQRIEIPFSSLSDSLDLSSISKIFIAGNGTVYFDNMYFSGETVVQNIPVEAAPLPISDPVDVLSIFSDSYSGLETVNLNPDWQQNTSVSVIQIQENNTLMYENLDYQGTDFGDTLDVTNMEWFHLDYWTENSTTLQIFLISPGPLEKPFDINVKQNSWQSIDIPLSEFSDVVNLSEVFQIKIVGDGTVFLDNLYFAKPPDLSPAPIPSHDSSKVVSLFSDHYENVTVDTWSAPWDQADVEDVDIDGDVAKFYSNLRFAGIEFVSQTIDGTSLTHLHFDMWTENPTDGSNNLKVKLVDFGANGVWSGGDDVEHELRFDAENTAGFVSKEWISFDIPLDDFENMTTREHLAQLLFVTRNDIKEMYIDNVYFYFSDAVNIENDEKLDIPTEVSLSQNYPNPFNPSTNIEFSIPKSSQVSLTIYNSIGQQVATLINTELSAGTYTSTWDASNVSSGVYYYQLNVNGATITKPMMLIK